MPGKGKGRSKWAIERWTVDVLPALSNSYESLSELSLREAIILAASMLDVALVEVLSKRLVGPENEIIEFLGADENGRAPCGSFGSRLQLARLIGLLSDEDLVVLRRVKKLRNLVAHRVKIDARVADGLRFTWEAVETPAYHLFLVMDGFFAGDKKVLGLTKSVVVDPGLRKDWAELTEAAREIGGSDFAKTPQDFTAPRFVSAFIPVLLQHRPEDVGPFVLSIILAIYETLFCHLLLESKPVEQLGITSSHTIWRGEGKTTKATDLL